MAGKGGRREDDHGGGPGPHGLAGRALRAHRRAGGQVGHHRRLRAGAGPRLRGGGAPGGPAARTRAAVRARRITPDDALVEYLEDHGLRRVSKRLVSSGVVDVVSTAIPGIRDVLVLGKIKQLEREEVADLIVVDAPATGHAITFLTSASGLVSAARGGPLRSQANDVVELLADPSRCRVILVTLPEDMPVSETIESAFTLEDKAGVQLGPVIVNATDPVPRGPRAVGTGGRRPGWTSTPPSWPRWRRPAASGWSATPSRPPRSSGWPRDLPLPQLLVPAVAGRDDRPGRDRPAGDGPGRRPSASSSPRSRPRERPLTSLVADRSRHRLLRLRRRGQDDGFGHLRPGRGAGRPAGLRGHRRPGPPPGRLAGRAVARQHARPRSRATGRATCTP